MEQKSLEEQAKELRKSGKMNDLTKNFKKEKADKKPKTTTPKTKQEEVTSMKRGRKEAEAVLIKVCKDLKLNAPSRVAAKGDSKSGLGSLQAVGVAGGVKVSVRSNDIIAYCPQSFLGYGRQHPGRWVHVTILSAGDANLEKAFVKALKDKKSGADWAKELQFVPRAQANTKEDLKSQKEKLLAKLKDIEALEKKAKAAKPKKEKKTAKSNPAITKVAETVA